MADERFPLEHFLGGEIASQDQALAGMKVAEEEQARRLDAARESQTALADAVAPLQKSLAESLGPGFEEAAANLQRVEQDLSARELAVPDVPREEERIFPGSIGLTRTPPYDYRWTWSVHDGPGSVAHDPEVSVAADNSTGGLGFSLRTKGRANAWSANGVGVYYRPVYSGNLQVVAVPSFNFSWGTFCAGAPSHSDGWLGLWIGQYNVAGGFDRVVVSQQLLQWKDDSWFWDAGQRSGSNPGYPLTAWIPVSTARWYAIWVWSGGSVYGAGWGGFLASGSSANSKLNVGVPLISMALI